jgi:glycosyltransferase involved in cell wall biosynthesis
MLIFDPPCDETPTAAPVSAKQRAVLPGRCERCLKPVIVRRGPGPRLCSSCRAGERALEQARQVESEVRSQLYPALDGVDIREPAAPARVMQRPSGNRSGLRVALLAPPWLTVPPKGYGGIEAVVGLLADALVTAGHEVTLLAAPGSRSTARVQALLDRLHPREIGASVVEADHVARAFEHIEQAVLDGRPFDIVHDHSGWVALAMADRLRAPVLHTVHGPFDDNARRFYAAHGHKAALTCLSRAQAAARPEGVRVDAVVPNPIDVRVWDIDVPKDDYLLWVGRFAPEKGAHRAIRVAQATGRRLVLAGPVQPGQEPYFAKQIKPHVDGGRIVYAGEIGGRRKLEAFAAAHAFLMPIRWPEPFGMVMVEAMAAGTPVIAFDEGSAPEVVEAGRSGFLVPDEDAMAAALNEIGQLDPAQCRASARERFAPERVAERYVTVYREICAQREACASPMPDGASILSDMEAAIA